MKNLFLSIPEPAIIALGWTLVHTLWQATVLAMASWIAFRVLQKSTPAKRYIAGIAALAVQVLFSAATFAYYFVNLSAYRPRPYPASAFSPSEAANTATGISTLAKIQLWLNVHMYELVICWLIGAGVLMLRFLAGWTYTQTLRNGSSPVADPRWSKRFDHMVTKLGITTQVEFRETYKILSPVVIGALRPTVLLPFGLLTGFSPNQIEAIVAHELAHIYRRDYLVNMLQSLVEVVFFFHPAIWWLSECVRREREFCCDDIAVQMSGDRVSLAGALAQVAEMQAVAAMAMGFASKKPLLLQRIRHVLGVAPKEPQRLTTLPMILVAFSLMLGVSFYATGQSDKKTTKPKRTINKPSSSKNPDEKALDADTLIPGKIRKEQKEENEEDMEVIYFDVEPNINFDLNLNTDSLVRHSMNISDPEIAMTISAKLGEINGLTKYETNALRLKVKELELEAEKLRFESERAERATEKLEWKKEQAAEARDEVIERQRELLDKSKMGKTSEEIEKRLGELENQIKRQEDQINELNTEIMKSHESTEAAEEPLRSLEGEIEALSERLGKSFALSIPGHGDPKSKYRYHYPASKEPKKATAKSIEAKKSIPAKPAKKVAPTPAKSPEKK